MIGRFLTRPSSSRPGPWGGRRSQGKDLVDVAAELQAFAEERGWEFCFIGGLAVQALAEPRLTRGTDMTLLTGFGSEEPFIDALLERYSGE